MIRVRLATAIACGMVIVACRRGTPAPRDLLLEARALQPDSAGEFKSMGTREIADLLARIGAYDDAVATARQDSGFFWMYYMDLARVRAMRGDVPGAVSMLGATVAPENMARAKMTLAGDLSERGDTANAFRIAHDLPVQDFAYVKLQSVPWQIEKGELAQAESTIVNVARSGVYTGDAWGQLAHAYYSRGDEARGNRIARLVPPSDERWEMWIDRMVLVSHRDWPAAVAIAESRPRYERSDAFSLLAREMARQKDTSRARQGFERAERAAMAFGDEVDRLRQLGAVAAAERGVGLPASAETLMVVPDSNRYRGRRPYPACDIASAFGFVHRKDVVLALNRGRNCDGAGGAFYQFRAGDVDGALRTLNQPNNSGAFAVQVETWIEQAAANADLPTALQRFAMLDAKRPSYDGQVAYGAAAIVREMARTDPARALDWARARRTAHQKAVALTELARVIIKKQDSTAARSLGAR